MRQFLMIGLWLIILIGQSVAAPLVFTDRGLFEKTVATDGALRADEIGLPLVNAIEANVWGQGFPAPLFANRFTVLEQRLVRERHLKLALDLDGRHFHAIWFRRTEPVPKEACFAYRPVIDVYNGTHRVQLVIECLGDA